MTECQHLFATRNDWGDVSLLNFSSLEYLMNIGENPPQVRFLQLLEDITWFRFCPRCGQAISIPDTIKPLGVNLTQDELKKLIEFSLI